MPTLATSGLAVFRWVTLVMSHTRAALLIIALLTATGCGDGQRDVPLPTTSAPSAPPVTATPTSDEQVTRQTYTQYLSASIQAAQIPSSEARAKLAPYTTPGYLAVVLRQIDQLHAKGRKSYGYLVPHVRSVDVNGDRATLYDCQDSTHAGEQDAKTGKKLNKGIPKQYVKVSLVKEGDGPWRISGLLQAPGRC